MTLDLYEILGLQRTASKSAVRKAYRKRALETHPDRNGDKAEFERVNLAYRILSDDAKRAVYDETGRIDANDTDNASALVVSILSNVLTAVLRELAAAGRSPAREDLVGHMRACLLKANTDVEQTRKQVDKNRKFLAEAVGRFNVKEGENYLDQLVRRDLVKAVKALAELDESLSVGNKAIDALKTFTFRTDGEPVCFARGTIAITQWRVQ